MNKKSGNYNITGEKIEFYRKLHGYSLRGFCEALEKERKLIIDHSNLSKIEKGERQVSDILIYEISQLLEEEISKFFK